VTTTSQHLGLALPPMMVEIRRRDEAIQCILDKMVHTLAAIGPKERGHEYIRACRVAGLTHPILFPIGAPKNALTEISRTTRELANGEPPPTIAG
jgi:hypothetical protein